MTFTEDVQRYADAARPARGGRPCRRHRCVRSRVSSRQGRACYRSTGALATATPALPRLFHRKRWERRLQL
jgi:hypothetical protein